MPDVFNLNDKISAISEGPAFANVLVQLGDGYEIRGNKNQAFTGADGQGGYASHKGLRRWRITIDILEYANSDTAKPLNKFLILLQNALGNYGTFYFYNPKETPTPDLTGINIIGRYLVRFEEPTVDIEWQLRTFHKATFTLIQVRA